MENDVALVHNKRKGEADMHEKEDGESPKENGLRQSNGIEAHSRSDRTADRQPDIVDDHPGKSRSTFIFC